MIKALLLHSMIDLFKILILSLVPTGFVVLTVYMLLKRYFDNQQSTLSMQQAQLKRSDAVQIKLQAYERLILFMERIDLPHLLLRLRNKSMNNVDLNHALMIAIQKEFEHNMVQQLYISDQLWEIIETAKDNVMSVIINQFDKVNPSGESDEMARQLIMEYGNGAQQSVATALKAIKQETRLLL